MDSKGNLLGKTALKRVKLLAAEYNRDQSIAAQVCGAGETCGQHTAAQEACAHASQAFVRFAYEAKVVTCNGGKGVATNGKKVAALWEKYKTAVAAMHGGKPLAKSRWRQGLRHAAALRSMA